MRLFLPTAKPSEVPVKLLAGGEAITRSFTPSPATDQTLDFVLTQRAHVSGE
jgi:hypothetical protein